jgi:hypothetical protein
MKIIHIKTEDPLKYGDDYVYIGRPSKFGNPFQIGPDGAEIWLYRSMRNT